MPIVLINLAQDWNSTSKYGNKFRMVCGRFIKEVKAVYELVNG
jgi:hypothetical protein